MNFRPLLNKATDKRMNAHGFYKNLFQFTDIALTPESVRCSFTVAALRPLPLKFR